MKKKARSNKFIKPVQESFDKTCKEFDIRAEDMEDILDSFFTTFKNTLEDPRLPTIRITNLGTFKTTIPKLNFYIKSAISRYRKGDMSYEDCKRKVQWMWTVRNRLKKERSGGVTYPEWKKESKLDELRKKKRGKSETPDEKKS